MMAPLDQESPGGFIRRAGSRQDSGLRKTKDTNVAESVERARIAYHTACCLPNNRSMVAAASACIPSRT
jgi:hypothetical protein